MILLDEILDKSIDWQRSAKNFLNSGWDFPRYQRWRGLLGSWKQSNLLFPPLVMRTQANDRSLEIPAKVSYRSVSKKF